MVYSPWGHKESDTTQQLTQVCHCFSSKEQASFNLVATVTVHSDFGAQENEIRHCFFFFPLPFVMK